MKAEVFHPSQLSVRDAAAWRAMCAAQPAFNSPLLSPEFAQLVGEARGDARVAVFRNGTETLGFLAHHRRPDGFARPIGAAFSDYHALITPPGAQLDAGRALAAAGLSALPFGALIDPYGLFAKAARPGETAYVIETGGDPEGYLAGLKAANPKRFRNWNRLRNKLEREVGEVVVTPDDRSPEALCQLMSWKREQYRRTGIHDIYHPAWARDLLQRAFERREGRLRGVMTTLRAGGELVAGHFGLCLDGRWHGWISSIHPEHAARGPGFVLMLEVPQIMRTLDLEAYDMAPSHAHYKAPFATREFAVAEGMALADSRAGKAVARREQVWQLAGAGRAEGVARLRRRLDHIAAVELSAVGRLKGLVDAVTGYGRRSEHRRIYEETAAREAA